MLKLMHKLNNIFTILNKYFYILPILSVLSNIRKTKIFVTINNFIKLIILINIILGVSLILYFTDFSSSLNTTYSIYADLLEPYIELIKHSLNKLIQFYNNLFNLKGSDSLQNELKSVLTESTSQMKSELKSEMIDVLDKMREDDIQAIDNLLKRIAVVSGVIFLSYFIFILPSDAAVDFTQYNWLNQSLINIKLSIIDLITKPSNPGNPGVDLNIPTPELNVIETTVDANTSQLSPSATSSISDGMSTVTPNTPIPTIQTLSEYMDHSTQTPLQGLDVSKMAKLNRLIGESLSLENKIKVIESTPPNV